MPHHRRGRQRTGDGEDQVGKEGDKDEKLLSFKWLSVRIVLSRRFSPWRFEIQHEKGLGVFSYHHFTQFSVLIFEP
jgi:hypothetical protein